MAGFAETRVYRSYTAPERVTTVRTTTVRPSYDVYRSWDRRHVYVWNDHRYHWNGGEWVVIEPGLTYGYRGPMQTSPVLQDDVGVDSTPLEEAYVPRTVVRVETPITSTLAIDVQRRLARRGYYHGPIDGVVGPGTRSAIIAFQADHGLNTTGYMSHETLDRLGL